MKYKWIFFVSAASAGLIPLRARAADATATLETKDSATATESAPLLKKFEENPEITDAKLKAEAGSLSIISLRFNLTYIGPAITDLGALNQPNPDGVVSSTATGISGNMGTRFRLSSSSTISVTAGISDLYAFRPEQTVDVNNPSISYEKAFRAAGIQFLSAPSLTFATQQVFQKVAALGWLGYHLTGVYALGRSGFSIGSDALFDYYAFNRDYLAGKHGDGKVMRISMGFSPMVSYNFTEKWRVYAATTFTLYNLRSHENLADIGTRTVSQRVGVGYAVTRDIYVSPHLKFYPGNPSFDQTTVNLSTSFSVL